MEMDEDIDLNIPNNPDPEHPRQEENKTPSLSSQSSVEIHSISSSHDSIVEYGYLG